MARFSVKHARTVRNMLGACLLSVFLHQPDTLSAQVAPPSPAKPLGLLPPEVKLSDLTIEKQDTVLGILSREPCSCGCVMVMARCLAVMPCHECVHLSNILVERIRSGYSRDQARLFMLASVPASQPYLPPPPTAAQFAARPIIEASVVPLSVEGDPTRGPATAPITIVEFSDFECSYCSEAARWADSVLAAYPKDVRIVFKQAPLPMHENAFLAAEASLAAHEQEKFWAMHDAMFTNNWGLNRQELIRRATEAGLNLTAFTQALDERRHKARVEQNIKEGDRAGIEGTPTFFLNGRRYNGARNLAAIKPVIEELLHHIRHGNSAPSALAAAAAGTNVTQSATGLPIDNCEKHGGAVRPAVSPSK